MEADLIIISTYGEVEFKGHIIIKSPFINDGNEYMASAKTIAEAIEIGLKERRKNMVEFK